MTFLKKLYYPLISTLLMLPAVAKAQDILIDDNDLIPIPQLLAPGPAGELTISEIIASVILLMLSLVGILAVLFVIIGGFRYVTAGGNEQQSASAKKTILNAVIGLVIVIMAFVIVRVIANALIFGDFNI